MGQIVPNMNVTVLIIDLGRFRFSEVKLVGFWVKYTRRI